MFSQSLKLGFVVMLLILSGTFTFAQEYVDVSENDYYHELFYDYLAKDKRWIEKRLKHEKTIVRGYHLSKENAVQKIVAYSLVSDRVISFSLIKNKCTQIEITNPYRSVEEVYKAFKFKYAELKEADIPGFFEANTNENFGAVAYFEDISMNIGCILLKIKNDEKASHILYYSRFMFGD